MNVGEYRSPSDQDHLKQLLEKTRAKLLDSSRRNRLINFREGARDVAIVDEMPDQVFQHLVVRKQSFDLLPVSEKDLEEKKEFDRILPISKAKETGRVAKRHTDNRLQTPFAKKDLDRRIRVLFREHTTIIQETGANNLFLAMGFLSWKDREDDASPPCKSPLFLVPVRLERIPGVGEATYGLEYDDVDIEANYSLVEKLRASFDLKLPLIEADQSPEAYWQEIERTIVPKAKNGWRVEREMVLGLFRFAKQVMYQDLDLDKWPQGAQLLNQPVLRHLLLGPGEGATEPGQLFDECEQEDPNAPRLPLIRDADSSQYSALIDALGRKDGLVIEGPPGTGKSQTITNLIAAAMDAGKSVLFVAEKMAALEVVFKRLADAGLDQFCLQMHGLKTSKRELLDSLMERINYQAPSARQQAQQESEVETAKQDLVFISKLLNLKVGPEGLVLHEVIWRIERLRGELPDDFEPLRIEFEQPLTLEQFNRLKNLLQDLGREWAGIPEGARAAWAGFRPERFDSSRRTDIDSSIAAAKASVEECHHVINQHDVNSQAPSLRVMANVMNLAELDGFSALPTPPVGAELALLHRVLKHGLAIEFGDLVIGIDAFLKHVAEVDQVFDFRAPESSSQAETIKQHTHDLAGIVCNPDTKFSDLKKVADEYRGTIELLGNLSELVKPVTDLSGQSLRSLADIGGIESSADYLMDGPGELSLHANPIHLKASIPNYLQQARQNAADLKEYRDGLSQFRVRYLR